MYLSSLKERGADAILPLIDTISRRAPRTVFLHMTKGGTFEVRNYPADGKLTEKYLQDETGEVIAVGLYDESVNAIRLSSDTRNCPPGDIQN